MKQGSFLLLLVVMMFCGSCKDRYYPEIDGISTNYLVVEGTLISGSATTNLQLSRTTPVNGSKGVSPEMNATVVVEGSDNSVKNLIMGSAGNYQGVLNLSSNNRYRVRIRTVGGKEYLSDFVSVKTTPEIDSIGFKQSDKGVQLYVNTHDPNNSTVYYRWEYDETWEIRSRYYSVLIYDETSSTSDKVRRRMFPQEDVFYCWKYGRSSSIYIGNSAKLTSDVIYQQPLNVIPSGDERLSVKYSILLRQYAMDKAAYEFYDLMKKNTESIGDIFGPLPSELRGNMHCVSDPKEIVIGYISATEPKQKRVFIDSPAGWPFQQYCETEFIIANADSTRDAFKAGSKVPIDYTSREEDKADGYLSSTSVCVDCTKRGGNTQRPAYWPQ